MNITDPFASPDMFGDALPSGGGPLTSAFLYPPFTVLDARSGFWQARKSRWIGLGIRSEIGRGENGTAKAFNMGLNATPENGWSRDDDHGSGTSIFDPVLCELLYAWFSPVGGVVIDPFAGGSVRGLVAGYTGRRYWGCDLSAEQIYANREQYGVIPDGNPLPKWVVGDSTTAVRDAAPAADFIIGCPPYFDLEVYSEDPRDLSTMDWDAFCFGYAGIIADCVDRLRPNRFAAFVVGDVRDDAGNFRNLPGLTTRAFRRAGMELYNEAVLVTATGSLAMRTGRQFAMSRKMGRGHQSVLVYVKGDARLATDAVTGMTADARRAALDEQSKKRANAISKWGE